jgi:hypothetical protein
MRFMLLMIPRVYSGPSTLLSRGAKTSKGMRSGTAGTWSRLRKGAVDGSSTAGGPSRRRHLA